MVIIGNGAVDPDPVGSETFGLVGSESRIIVPKPDLYLNFCQENLCNFRKLSFKMVQFVFDYMLYIFPSKILNKLKKPCSSTIMCTFQLFSCPGSNSSKGMIRTRIWIRIRNDLKSGIRIPLNHPDPQQCTDKKA
jgi:hypothetical protein